MEKWKPVSRYRRLYAVSNRGRVKSVLRTETYRNRRGTLVTRTRQERILKQFTGDDGYHRVNLSKNGVAKTFYVHVLVARAFVPNPDDLPEVNHKDRFKYNCRASNLEWTTHAGNMAHSSVNDGHRRCEDHPHSKLTWKKVKRIRKLKRTTTLNNQELADRFGVTRATIRGIVNHTAWRRPPCQTV